MEESKTDAGRGRTVPLNSKLIHVLAEYKQWYKKKVGAVTADYYVFPSRLKRTRLGRGKKKILYDPSHPLSTLKTAWTNVREKAGVHVRMHDLRHTAITKLAETGAPEETIMAIAGHVSRRMLTHYAHVRTQAKRTALEAIATSFTLGEKERTSEASRIQ